MNIRLMTKEDTHKLSDLMDQLGYPSENSKIQKRFNKILSLPDYKTIIAEIDGKLAGFIGMCKQMAYETDDPYIRVLALVVHKDYRRQGVGKELMLTAEEWAKENNCYAVTLNSGNREERIAAHRFYQNLGYETRSTGFSKMLS